MLTICCFSPRFLVLCSPSNSLTILSCAMLHLVYSTANNLIVLLTSNLRVYYPYPAWGLSTRSWFNLNRTLITLKNTETTYFWIWVPSDQQWPVSARSNSSGVKRYKTLLLCYLRSGKWVLRCGENWLFQVNIRCDNWPRSKCLWLEGGGMINLH